MTAEEADRLRRFVRMRVVILGGYVVVLVAGVLVSVAVLGRQHPERHPHIGVLIGLVIAVPLVAGAVSLLTIRRVLLRPTPTRRLIVSGSAKDRRRVNRLLRKGEALDEGDRPIAQAQVELLRRQRRFVWLLVLLGIGYFVLLAVDEDRQVLFHAALGVLYLVLAAFIWWSGRRVERHAAAQGITPTPRR